MEYTYRISPTSGQSKLNYAVWLCDTTGEKKDQLVAEFVFEGDAIQYVLFQQACHSDECPAVKERLNIEIR